MRSVSSPSLEPSVNRHKTLKMNGFPALKPGYNPRNSRELLLVAEQAATIQQGRVAEEETVINNKMGGLTNKQCGWLQ